MIDHPVFVPTAFGPIGAIVTVPDEQLASSPAATMQTIATRGTGRGYWPRSVCNSVANRHAIAHRMRMRWSQVPMATTGLSRCWLAVEPAKTASPKLKIPPSVASSQ